MTTIPYYFYAYAGTNVNMWMTSNDFQPEITLYPSGTLVLIDQETDNGWKYTSSFFSAILTASIKSDGVYEIDATSNSGLDSGSFEIYLSQGYTASLDIVQMNTNGVSRLMCSPKAGKMFVVPLPYKTPPSSLAVVDVYTYSTSNIWNYPSKSLCDCVYNSVDDTVWVWAYSNPSSSFLDVYNSSGSALLTSSLVSVDFNGDVPGTFNPPRMTYNNDTNQILLLVHNSNYDTNLNYYIVNCSDGTIVYSQTMSFNSGAASNCAYASSSKTYYIVSDNTNDNILKVDGATYISSSSPMTGSQYMLSYIHELGVLIGGSAYQNFSVGALVYNPITETLITTIPGIGDGEANAVYDPCRGCIVISDDVPTIFTGHPHGGFACAFADSYTPMNSYMSQIRGGIYYIEYCSPTSTIWTSNYSDGRIEAFVLSHPTGSFPLVIPPAPPVPLPSFCVTPPFQAYGVTGSTSTPVIITY